MTQKMRDPMLSMNLTTLTVIQRGTVLSLMLRPLLLQLVVFASA
jgi:hypothetical protein